MPKLCRACAGFFIGSSPSSDNSPLVGGNSVVSILIVVVFPAPFGPRNAKISPRCTSNDTLSTAVKSPNFFTSFSTRITVPSRGSPHTAERRSLAEKRSRHSECPVFLLPPSVILRAGFRPEACPPWRESLFDRTLPNISPVHGPVLAATPHCCTLRPALFGQRY